jgi:hypothetical protein
MTDYKSAPTPFLSGIRLEDGCYHPINYGNQLVTGILSVSSVFVDK